MKERIEKMKNTKKKGFTLVELLVVIAIMAILALIAVPNFSGYIDKSRDARIQSDLKTVYSAAIVSIEDSDGINLDDAVSGTSEIFNESIKSLVNFSSEKDDQQYYERYKFLNKQNQLVVEYEDVNGKKHYYPKEVGMIGGGETGETESGYSDEEIEALIAEGYIPVATADELNNVRSATLETYGKGTKWEGLYEGGLDKKYVQVDNIYLSEYSAEGWIPIGTDEEGWLPYPYGTTLASTSFKGTYNGGNYVIRELKVKGEDNDYQGLFGLTEGATIRNVGLIDNTVTGSWSVGGLVGGAQSSFIENSYAKGSVEGLSSVGGLVGGALESTIENSYSTGSVTSSGMNVGGLVGEAYGSSISNSYATGSVKGTGNFTGGLVGSASSSTITNSYWDTETTGQSTSDGGGEGKSTEEMKKKDTYSGWDFDSVWKIDEGNDYPELR